MRTRTRVRPHPVAAELIAALTLLIGAACGTEVGTNQNASAQVPDLAIPTLNTFDSRYIQIDACPDTTNGSPTFGCALDANGNPLWGPDANLYFGDDPADGSHSVNRPNPNGSFTSANWIDWNDLTDVANHVQADWQTSGKDPTAFPQSNECVGAAQVLSKMDLVNVGFSNNADFAFIAVQRAGNNGDAGYYWVFTKLPPHLDLGAAPCSATQQRLTYDIQAGDVLLVGHYHPSSTLPLLQAFKAVPQSGPGGVTNYDAVSAIDYTNANLWTRDNNAVIGVAVNETPTAISTLANGFGLDGMKNIVSPNGTTCKTATGCLDIETFAEAAVFSNFFTGGSPCGVTFYGSIITRSSGSGGTSPDLKDLAGPYRFNFGAAKVQAAVAPSCDQKFGYEITSFQGLAGTETTPTSCTWFLNGAGFPPDYQFDTTCSAYHVQQFFANANLNGAYTVRVKADAGNNCTDTSPNLPVNVFPPLQASCSLTPTCNLSFGYADGFTGGSGSVSYAWNFSGGGTTTPSSSNTASGTVAVSTGAVNYNANLVITDQRTDLPGQCQATCNQITMPFAPVQVLLSSTPASLTCSAPNSNFDTAGTFTAAASGGSGGYTYLWGGAGAACGGATCNINETNTCGDASLSVQVLDAVCGLSNQPTGHYTKVTTVTTSVSN